MNSLSIRINCPSCCARIKAPRELAGQRRPCPRCRRSILIRRPMPRDSDPVLVVVEG